MFNRVVCFAVAVLLLAPITALAQPAIDYSDLACYQVAFAFEQSGVSLGPSFGAESQPAFNDLDKSDDAAPTIEGSKLHFLVSPEARQAEYMVSVFEDLNHNCRFDWGEAQLVNFPADQLVFDGEAAVIAITPVPANTCWRLTLGTKALTPEIVNSGVWNLGFGEVEDFCQGPNAGPERPATDLTPPAPTPPNDNGGQGGNQPPADNNDDEDQSGGGGGGNNDQGAGDDCESNCPPTGDDNNQDQGGDNHQDHGKPDKDKKPACNSGKGNGAEDDGQGGECDPGNSGEHNNANDEDGDNDHGNNGHGHEKKDKKDKGK